MVKTLLLNDPQTQDPASDTSSQAAAPQSPAAAASPVAEAPAQTEPETNAEAHADDAAHADEAHADDAHADDAHASDDHAHDEHADDEGAHEGEEHGDDHGDHSFLSTGHLMGHVQDSDKFEVSFWITGQAKNEGGSPLHIDIPQLPDSVVPTEPIAGSPTGILQPWDMKVTKFMVLEVLVALTLVAVFVPLARRIRTGERPKGRWWNLMETLIVYIRDQVARPSIGHHDADKYMPFLWTIFFFILFGNLCGLIPFLGSPTGALGTTVVLALSTFLVVLWTGITKMGPIGFLKAQVPHMDLPWFMAIFIVPLIFALEIAGLFIKHAVLSIRLFANMFAGHLVLAVLLAFIGETWGSSMVYAIAPASIGASVAVNLLELFVAFLQAYIFTFLSALFIGAAAHSH